MLHGQMLHGHMLHGQMLHGQMLHGWGGGSNGNKANLSPARAGTGLSLAIS